MRRLVLVLTITACHGAPSPAAPTNQVDVQPFVGRGAVTPAEIIRHWRDGTWTVSDVVDPARGLVRYWTETGEPEVSPPDIRAHLCGVDLVDALHELDGSIREIARLSDNDDLIHCREGACSMSIAGEYEPERVLLFDVRAGAPTALVGYLEMGWETERAAAAQPGIRAWAAAQARRPCADHIGQAGVLG